MKVETMFFIHSKEDIEEFVDKTKEFLDINPDQISIIHVFCVSRFLYYLFILYLYLFIHPAIYFKDKEEYHKLFKITNKFSIKLYKVKRFSLYDFIVRDVYDSINRNIPKVGVYYNRSSNEAFHIDYSKRKDYDIFNNEPCPMIVIPGELIENIFESTKRQHGYENKVAVYDMIEFKNKNQFLYFCISGFESFYIPKEIENFNYICTDFIDENRGDYVISKKYFTDIKMRIDPDTMRIIEPPKFEESEYKGFIISLKRPILYISDYNLRVF